MLILHKTISKLKKKKCEITLLLRKSRFVWEANSDQFDTKEDFLLSEHPGNDTEEISYLFGLAL